MLAGQSSRTKLSLGSLKELGWIGNRHEVEPLSRRRRAGSGVVTPLEQCLHVGQRASSQPDIHHGSHQHPDHVVKESVCLDGEAHTPVFGTELPIGPRNSTAVVGLVSLCSEGPEIVLAQDGASSLLHGMQVEPTAERPFETAAKRGGRCLVGPDVVSVSAGKC